ncbi:MAG: hypothetical protein HY821_09230 [Acidobacteria bacterium]|nr:hypothetical protein [Acidobacteriota bacterium]
MKTARLISLSLGLAAFGFAQEAAPSAKTPIKSDVSPDLITMMLSKPTAAVELPREVIQKHGPTLEDVGSAATVASVSTPVNFVQSASVPTPAFSATPGLNFEGLGTGFAGYSVFAAPPDTTLAVGPNHVVQWVNSHIAIFDKSGNPTLGAPGFVAGNVLWTGFGGLCESTNRGDPLVAYDKIADRWVFSQFAFNVSGGLPATPYLQCFAVSTGPNPAGPYNRYAYDFSTFGPSGTPEFNDYGKIGVWPDAYYLTYNAFGGSPAGSNTGVIVCAYDRAAMVAGSGAVQLCAPFGFYMNGASLLPSDLEGNTALPAAGTPNFMMRQNGVGGVSFRMMKFKVNSFSPPSMTFDNGMGGGAGSFISFPITLTRPCNGTGGTCVPQPGTATLLDTLGARMMYRLGYRNRGGVESLVGSMSEDPDGAGTQASALRWFEMRAPSSNAPSMYQMSTFNPDTTNRWMSSIAMDKNGNMALGYSVSSSSVNPGIRITGRLRSDIRNRMQGETTIVNGSGSQTTYGGGTPLTRWGDYSTMRVDPANDCTFWYTTEYIAANGAFNWRTRIASFRFPNCQ